MTAIAGAGAIGRADLSKIPPFWLLGLLTLSGPVGMHIFAPVLAKAARDFSVGTGAIQATISFYIAGLAIGQLGYGPISDRFGRRPVVLAGLATFTLAGLAAAIAHDVNWLIAARFVQGLGGAAGLTLARAMVRDTTSSNDAARRLALLNVMVAIGPAIAPTLGGLLATGFGWRSILWLLCGIGLFLVVLAIFLLTETRPATKDSNARELAQHYGRLASSPAFLGLAIGGGCATTSMYAMVASSPFIMTNQLHRPEYETGLFLGVLISGILIGNALVSRLVLFASPHRLMMLGNFASVIAAALILAVAAFDRLTILSLFAPTFLFTLGAGLAGPMALTQALSLNARVVGSAAGLYGFIQMAVGALCISLSGLLANAALNAGAVLVGAQVIAQIAFFIAASSVRRAARLSGEPTTL